jgi:hypothetical protein
MVDGDLYVLARGRIRGAGGASAEVEDRAGTIYVVDPEVTEPIEAASVGEFVRTNGRIFAEPTQPPFKLWDRSAVPPESDRRTDRPYCTLRFHQPTQNFYLCAFSGVDKPWHTGDPIAFSKNATDAVLRYDLRTGRWYSVERHDPESPGYPHQDPLTTPPPHGWLNGPDNCLALGDGLYVVSKDNSRLVRYDLSAIEAGPEAGPPRGEMVLGSTVPLAGGARQQLDGQSALAFHDGWLYVGTRTSSVIVRLRLDAAQEPVRPIEAELVARFDPYDSESYRSANITDMDFDDDGRLYVISAEPAKVYRFRPDPARVFDARNGAAAPWFDLGTAIDDPAVKGENVLYHDGWLYVTSGNGYAYQDGAWGTVYRVQTD